MFIGQMVHDEILFKNPHFFGLVVITKMYFIIHIYLSDRKYYLKIPGYWSDDS